MGRPEKYYGYDIGFCQYNRWNTFVWIKRKSIAVVVVIIVPELKNAREDFVVTFYNGAYPNFYPIEIMNIEESYNKKTQDKKI